MTNEEVWKVIDENFKGKAVNDFGRCEYLTECGKKCAIGLFIPDGHNSQEQDLSANDLFDGYPDLLDEMPVKDLGMLCDWQTFHDSKLNEDKPVKEQKAALFNKFVILRKRYKA